MCPKWFWTVQIILVKYQLFWTGPIHFGQVQIILVRSKSFWTIPNHFEQVQIMKISPEKSDFNLNKIIWTWPKLFGPDKNDLELTKTICNRPKSFRTHRRTRHFVAYNHQTKVRQKNPVTIFCKRIGQNLVKTLSLAQAKFRAYLKITCLEVIYDKVQEHSLYKKYN